MEQTQSEECELASAEPADEPAPRSPAGATPVTGLESNEAKSGISRQPKLSGEEAREAAQPDADTTLPASEIARTFDVGESSVYRLGERQAATQRGTQMPPGAPQAEPAAAGARGHHRGPPAAKRPDTRSRPASWRPRRAQAALGRFRIRFLVERVVQARDIRDALRQADSVKGFEVIALMREA